MFASRISLRQSALLCRSLGTMLHSGLPIIKAFDMAAAKAPDPKLPDLEVLSLVICH